MPKTDTPGHALALLDRAALMRLDPEPEVATIFNAGTDEPVTAGPEHVNPEVYVSILVNLDLANMILDQLGWAGAGAKHGAWCSPPRVEFMNFQAALTRAGSCSRAYRHDDLVAVLDVLLDSAWFTALHRALALLVSCEANAPCSSLAHQKR